MSLLTGDPCSATIRARGDVRALTISKNDFDNLLARNPVLNRYFTKLLALRLNKMSQAFSEAGGAVTGDLSILGPTEVIQAITVTDRTGRLVIRSQQTFDMVFVQGQIHRIDAPIDGEEMFYEFLTWTKGEFRFEPDDDIDVERNFFKNATSLLLEGMRRLDEA